MAATEIWFNSLYHLKTFLQKASSLVAKHPELSGRGVMPDFTAKAQLMPPPVDFTACLELAQKNPVQRDPRLVFVDTRGADVRLLNDAMGMLSRRGEECRLITVGPLDGLGDELPRTTISEKDEQAQILALHQAAVVMSARPGATIDLHAIRALRLGCWPVLPDTGFYPELLPRCLHPLCLYNSDLAERLVTQVQNVWWIERPPDYQEELAGIIAKHDAPSACAAMDDRLEQLVIAPASAALSANKPRDRSSPLLKVRKPPGTWPRPAWRPGGPLPTGYSPCCAVCFHPCSAELSKKP
jgi:hypothetical protein